MKVCKTCGIEKPLTDFRIHRHLRDGRGNHCKVCVNLANHKDTNPEWYERLLLRQEGKKCCPNCGEVKFFSEYPQSPKRLNGVGGWCKSCRRVDSKQDYWSDPEKSRTSARKRSNEWRDRNPQHASEYYFRNREKYVEYNKYFRSTDRGKLSHVLSEHRRNKRAKSVENDLSIEDVDFLLSLQDNKCAMCGEEFTKRNSYTLDHIVPLSKGGGLTLGNVQLLHQPCNASKGTKTIRYRKPLDVDRLGVGEIK